MVGIWDVCGREEWAWEGRKGGKIGLGFMSKVIALVGRNGGKERGLKLFVLIRYVNG
jgi:hypothetical protein